MGMFSPPPGPNHHNYRHGQSGGKCRLYGIWQAMKNRCRNPNQPGWKSHGARGIRVCAEWQAFEPFRAWALANGFRDGLSIERRDNDGNYEPANCTWIPKPDQNLNTRRIVWVEINGERLRLKEAAKLSHVPYTTACQRIRKGADPLRALEIA